MKHLTIENVGPIVHVDFEVQRFNFFIGPQSSGKSTVAKILSTCQWMEKEIATLMDDTLFNDSQQFKSQFENYHRMMGYFSAKSYIKYESDVVLIVYRNETPSITLKSRDGYQRYKICYTPAERNMITSPELQGFEFGQTSLRSFLFDWYNAREQYNEKNKVNVLDLDVKYFYDPTETRYKDRIEHANGVRYNIPLYASSSGLQSVVPLQVMAQYFSDLYFQTFDQRTSFDLDSKIEIIRRRCVEDVVLKSIFPNYKHAQYDECVTKANEMYHEGNPKVLNLYKEFRATFNRLSVPDKTSFIIEEPEQNLYPYAQLTLLETLFRICQTDRNHELTITTHSPFVLSYLNILVKRHDVQLENKVSVDPNQLNVFAMQDGRSVDLVNINPSTGKKSINADDLVEAMQTILAEYKELKSK